jgi:hypothetical protein
VILAKPPSSQGSQLLRQGNSEKLAFVGKVQSWCVEPNSRKELFTPLNLHNKARLRSPFALRLWVGRADHSQGVRPKSFVVFLSLDLFGHLAIHGTAT